MSSGRNDVALPLVSPGGQTDRKIGVGWKRNRLGSVRRTELMNPKENVRDRTNRVGEGRISLCVLTCKKRKDRQAGRAKGVGLKTEISTTMRGKDSLRRNYKGENRMQGGSQKERGENGRSNSPDFKNRSRERK